LIGYFYAHLLARAFSPRNQVLTHFIVLGIGALFLPIRLSANWNPPADAPVLPLLGILVTSLGWPFCALSANAPLLQNWFARSGHARAGNPYFLYAASNAGSLAALLAYPFLIEPSVTLGGQSFIWAYFYFGLIAAVVCSGLFAARGTQTVAIEPATTSSWPERLTWLAYAALPSSLLLGVTGYVTTDVASFPLLWIAPLALYLLTFVLTFAARPPIPHRIVLRALPAAILLAAAGFWLGPLSIWAAVGAHFLAFFLIAMACHGEMARRRPQADRLTEFYFWMSLGGVAGGALTALVSPLVFKEIIEYPLALSAVCLLLPLRSFRDSVLLLFAAAIPLIEPLAPFSFTLSIGLSLWIVAMLLFAAVAKRDIMIGVTGVLVASLIAHTFYIRAGDVVWRDRSFYGAYTVTENKAAKYRVMFHGTTLHGVERIGAKPEALTYYSPKGPLGDVMRAVGPRAQDIGAIGLGVGSEACFARPAQSWTFYEIDPLVGKLASRSGLFHTLTTCAPQAKLVYGDGRLNLAHSQRKLDILILDAFSSDAIPIHLMTREAFATYLRALKPHGVMMAHITNRYFNLAPIIARIAPEDGLVAYERNFHPTAGTDMALVSLSRWVVLARDPADLGAIAHDPHWTRLQAAPGTKLWTDDFADVLSALQ